MARMLTRPRAALLLAAGPALLAGAASAQIIDPVNSVATINQPTQIMVSPNGMGMTLASQGSVVTLFVVDVTGMPVAGLAWSDLEIDGWPPLMLSDGVLPPATWDAAPGGFAPGAVPGQYTFSGTLYAGGWTQGALVKVRGVQIGGAPLPLNINSPDITGDGIVNLSDIGWFSNDLASGYNFRSDFNGDGIINLTDVGFMASQIGAVMPPGYVIDPVD